MEKTSRASRLVLRAIISAVLLALLVWYIHPKEIGHTLLVANPIYVGLAFVLALLSVVISTLKWDVILRLRGLRVRFTRLLGSYFVSHFVGNFLPSRYGGDIVRIYDVAKDGRDGVVVTTSVLAERFSGLLVLLLIGLAGGIASYPTVQNERIVIACAALFALGISSVLVLGMNWWKPVVRKAGKLLGTDILDRLSRELRETFLTWRVRPAACLGIFFLSITFYGLAIFGVFLNGEAVGMSVPLLVYVTFVPVIYVLEALPVSLNGLGVREGAIVYLFGHVGVPAAAALSLGILVLGVRLLTSVIGGIVFVCRRSVPSAFPETTRGSWT